MLSKLLWTLWAHSLSMEQNHEILAEQGYIIHTDLILAEFHKRDVQFYTDLMISSFDMESWSAG